MSYYNKTGRAYVNPDKPQAFAVCDYCGMWWNHVKLKWQVEWNATQLYNKRMLVCPDCYDAPHEQFRTVILPPDPPPVINPRLEPYRFDEVNFLVTQPQSRLVNLTTQDGVPLVSNKASENFPD